MPGDLWISQALSSARRYSDRMTEGLIDSLSPLTPQAIESDDMQINNNPITLSRTETSITQVYTEGGTSSREQFKGSPIPEDQKIVLLNPQMVLHLAQEPFK
jgi:hypothetical protein